MEYLKGIIQKEKISLGEFDVFSQLFEMLGNQQEYKNILKKSLTLINSLEGEVSLLNYKNERHHLIAHLGNKDSVDYFLEHTAILKQIKEKKKPYFRKNADEKIEHYYIILPIVSKNDEYQGALCIHKEQTIDCWDKIVLFLNMMTFIYKYYDLIEINKSIATRDLVTDLFNYRHFQDQLDLEIDKATRFRIPVSLVLIDLVDFKQINERLDYAAGDEVLRQFGDWIQKTTRRIDMPARLDKDTFAILLTNTNEEGARTLLKRLLIKVETKTVKVGGHEFRLRVKSSYVPYQSHYSKDEFLTKAVNELSNLSYKDLEEE